jgi:hypothetical protein
MSKFIGRLMKLEFACKTLELINEALKR